MLRSEPPAEIVVEEVTDPEELAAAQARRKLFDLNTAWFKERARGIYAQNRGKCVVVAAEQIFVADTPDEAWALVEAAHVEDDGSFSLYIPKEVMPRIYAHTW